MIRREPPEIRQHTPITDLLQRNKHLPHIRTDELKPFWVRGISSTEDPWSIKTVKDVPVDLIVASSVLTGWHDIKNEDSNKLVRIVEGLESEKFKPEDEPIILLDYGGIYSVYDGQKRIMAAKALGINTWPARVQRFMPTTLEFSKYTSDYHGAMGERMEDGLWKGKLEELSLNSHGELERSLWSITSYQGLWVFANNMEKSHDIYQELSASGQAPLLI